MKIKNLLNEIICIILFSIIYLFLLIVMPELKANETFLLMIYVYILYYSYKINNGISIIFFFILSFGVFNLSNIFFSKFSKQYWWNLEIFNYGYLNIETVIYTLKILIIAILGLYTGMTLYKNCKKKYTVKIKEDKIWEKVSQVIIYISFLPLLMRLILEIKIIKMIGYAGLYNGEFFNYSLPIWTKGWNILFFFSYYLFLASKPSHKNFLKCSFIFVIINLIQSLKGGRTILGINLLLILTYYIILFKKQVTKKMILIFVPLILFFQLISNMRSSINSSMSIVNSIIKFFKEQGGSVGIIGLNKLFIDKYLVNPTLMLFSPIRDYIVFLFENYDSKKQSLEVLLHTTNISAHLSYQINKEYYLLGFGVGGNYLAELYNFGGIIFIFFINVLLGYTFPNIEKNLLSSRFKLYMMIPIIKNLYISPRASFFPVLSEIIQFFLIYCVFLLFTKFLKSIMNKKIKKDIIENQ
ncbi:O-antigen polysaccharide polymerase Wzy [Fusobacterium varium]|uniref:O-antigen polysaccharide polymerase Wzy n=1 Tax=Fusobacterium varium TaxID=856 RepID=UPI00242AF2D1|nr:O-antigen polysaccharide polymerase Wzy [Fusobacterium varium]MCF0170151.1 O-antigen polysaccharide polymerase Wzy [Fusobacterium varium]